MGPKQKTVTVTEALTRNLAPLLEMKVNEDGISTAFRVENNHSQRGAHAPHTSAPH